MIIRVQEEQVGVRRITPARHPDVRIDPLLGDCRYHRSRHMEGLTLRLKRRVSPPKRRNPTVRQFASPSSPSRPRQVSALPSPIRPGSASSSTLFAGAHIRRAIFVLPLRVIVFFLSHPIHRSEPTRLRQKMKETLCDLEAREETRQGSTPGAPAPHRPGLDRSAKGPRSDAGRSRSHC